MAARARDVCQASELPTFEEIDCCVAGPGVNLEIGPSSLYDGCSCVDICTPENLSQCTCKVAYDSSGHIPQSYLQPTSPPVFECNSNCKCSSRCPNRTTQSGGAVPGLSVVKTEKKGCGVCAQVDICRGTYVGEYVGEVITGVQAKERLCSRQNTSQPCYVVQYREHTATGTVITTNIDATYKGNTMRFINHSCSPNLSMVAVRSDSIVPRLCLFAGKNISAGEELCFSYYGSSGAEVNREALQLGKQPCYCGSANCVRFLPMEL